MDVVPEREQRRNKAEEKKGALYRSFFAPAEAESSCQFGTRCSGEHRSVQLIKNKSTGDTSILFGSGIAWSEVERSRGNEKGFR